MSSKPFLSLSHANNGWVLSRADEEDTELPTVVEDGDIDEAHALAVQRLLYLILEEIGEYGSKHDPYRVRVVIEENLDTRRAVVAGTDE